MALLLSDGGFVLEAIQPTLNALDFCIKTLKTLDESVFINIYGLLEKLKKDSKNEEEIKNMITESKSIIENLSQKINLAIL